MIGCDEFFTSAVQLLLLIRSILDEGVEAPGEVCKGCGKSADVVLDFSAVSTEDTCKDFLGCFSNGLPHRRQEFMRDGRRGRRYGTLEAPGVRMDRNATDR